MDADTVTAGLTTGGMVRLAQDEQQQPPGGCVVRPLIAVVGSAEPTRTYDPPLRHP